MPYRSEAQSAYIHMKASEGVPWAKKFVADSHGEKVPHTRHVKHKRRRKVRHRR